MRLITVGRTLDPIKLTSNATFVIYENCFVTIKREKKKGFSKSHFEELNIMGENGGDISFIERNVENC